VTGPGRRHVEEGAGTASGEVIDRGHWLRVADRTDSQGEPY
jgi:hypothetical protein